MRAAFFLIAISAALWLHQFLVALGFVLLWSLIAGRIYK
jgi:hypothetical protein